MSARAPDPSPQVLTRAWALGPHVSLRDEPFGAMAYDHSTRRLSFLKDPRLADLVRRLAAHPSALDACRSAGIDDSALPLFEHGLQRLVETGMLVGRPTAPSPAAPGTAPGVGEAVGGRRATAGTAAGTTGSRLADRFERGLHAPICLTWELTYACNLSCVHCLSSSGRRDPDELSTRECEAVIDELEDLQVFYVNIGGGEPTIRPDFWHLLDYATHHHVGVKFSTNGTRITPSRARWLSGTDYVDVQISLDGATADVNDAVRGDGSYASARRAMANLAEAGCTGFKVSVVVTRHNVDQLDRFKVLADDHGAQLRITRLRPSGRGAAVWSSLHPAPEQQRALYEWLREHGDGVLTGDSFFHLGAYGDPLPGLNLCGAGRVVCLVDPVGDVYACPFTIHDDFRAGSVRGPGGFAAVWRTSTLFTSLRSPGDGGACNACSAFGTCRGGCMASKYFTGLPLDGPDPECVKGHGQAALAQVDSTTRPWPSVDHSPARRVPVALSRPAGRRSRVAATAPAGG